MILSGVSTTGVEIRRTPSGNNVSSADPNSNNFFGRPESFSLNETIQVSFEIFKGETVFKPRTWAIKISPTFSVPNYLNARENGIVNVDVRRGTTRTDYHVSLEDAFGEVKLFDTNDNYDFGVCPGGHSAVQRGFSRVSFLGQQSRCSRVRRFRQ